MGLKRYGSVVPLLKSHLRRVGASGGSMQDRSGIRIMTMPLSYSFYCGLVSVIVYSQGNIYNYMSVTRYGVSAKDTPLFMGLPSQVAAQAQHFPQPQHCQGSSKERDASAGSRGLCIRLPCTTTLRVQVPI